MLLLLEAHDAGRTLNVTTARIRQLVSEGVLVAAARTPRGTHLFRAEVVEALRVLRAQGRREARRPGGAARSTRPATRIERRTLAMAPGAERRRRWPARPSPSSTLREKAGHAEDEPELYRLFQTFIADAQDFAEKVRAIETQQGADAGRHGRADQDARRATCADRRDARPAGREAGAARAIGADEAWAQEITLPQGNNLLAALQITEARRELAAMSDIEQDLLLRDPGPAGRLARKPPMGCRACA